MAFLQITVMEVSFLVVFLAAFLAFLAFFDSVKVCADREEVPTANWKRWITVEGSQRAVNVICSDDKNHYIISVISVISVRQVGIGWIQPREYSNTIS